MKLRQIAEPVEFDAFHWALHLRGTGRSAARGAVGLEPLAIRLPDGRAWTYRVVGGELVANAGVHADAGTVVVLDADAFSDFATEVVTVPGLAVMGRVSYDSGSYAAFDAWEPALRSLYHGRPVFDPASVDRAAAARTFRWGVDSTAEIGAQVQRFGFAVVRGVLARHRVAQLSAEIERIRGDARSDDGRSWWVTAPNGSDLVCQLHYTSLESDLIADLERDPDLLRLVAASGHDLIPHGTCGNGHFAVLKNPGATGGLTDLPWHVDCGLGGHPVLCPGIHIGIHLTPVNADTGGLGFVAGTHRCATRRPSGALPADWPVVWVDAQPGDVTVHVPDALHAAPPPNGLGSGRRTLYLSFGRAETLGWLGEGRGYDQLLFAGGTDGHVEFEAVG